MLVDNGKTASLLKTIKPMTTETGNSGISGYRYRYRSAGSLAITYRYRTFSQNAQPQGVAYKYNIYTLQNTFGNCILSI